MNTEWPRSATSQQREATEEFLRRLLVKYSRRIRSVALFGSVARGDFTPDSDIDVLIVAEDADVDFEWDVWGIAARVSLEWDVLLDAHVYSRALWDHLRAIHRPLWRNVEREGIELTLKPSPV